MACRAFFVLLTLWTAVPLASACSCGRAAPEPCKLLSGAETIFVGKVVEVENPPTDRRGDQGGKARYRFRVDEWFAGKDEASVIDVFSGRGGGDCSSRFDEGGTYLVFARQAQGKLWTGACSPTELLIHREALVGQLRTAKAGQRLASFFGVLRRTTQPYSSVEAPGYEAPLPRTSVRLVDGKKVIATETDDGGKFAFYEVPAGEYRIEAELPPNLILAETISSKPLPSLKLPSDACYEQDLDALPAARIRGRLIADDGRAVRTAVELFRPERYDPNKSAPGWSEFADEQGYFTFEHVAPGEYVLVVNNDLEPDPDAPYPRTFFPGVHEYARAGRVIVPESGGTIEAVVYLSRGRPIREVSVRVIWSDQQEPAKDVLVWGTVADGKFPHAQQIAPGKYRLRLFVDGSYTIYAQALCRQVESNKVPVNGAEAPAEILLVLPGRGCT
jgi:hypothetical protein